MNPDNSRTTKHAHMANSPKAKEMPKVWQSTFWGLVMIAGMLPSTSSLLLADPVIQLNPKHLEFSATRGVASSETKSISMTNTGDGVFETVTLEISKGYDSSPQPDWLEVACHGTGNSRTLINSVNELKIPFIPDGQSTPCLSAKVDVRAAQGGNVTEAQYGVHLCVKDTSAPVIVVFSPAKMRRCLRLGQRGQLFWGERDSVSWRLSLSGGSQRIVSWTARFSPDNGLNWTFLDNGTTYSQDGMQLPWEMPEVTSTNCLIRISARNAYGEEGKGDSPPFGIRDSTMLTVRVTCPDGGETVETNKKQTIRWETVAPNPIASRTIHLEGGKWARNKYGAPYFAPKWVFVDSAQSNLGYFEYMFDRLPAGFIAKRIRVAVYDVNGFAAYDLSDQDFNFVDASQSNFDNAPPNAVANLGITPVTSTGRGICFQLRLPAPGRCDLKAFDVLGKRVWEMDIQGAFAGIHFVPWPTGNRSEGMRHPNGVYLLRLTQNDQSKAIKVHVGK